MFSRKGEMEGYPSSQNTLPFRGQSLFWGGKHTYSCLFRYRKELKLAFCTEKCSDRRGEGCYSSVLHHCQTNVFFLNSFGFRPCGWDRYLFCKAHEGLNRITMPSCYALLMVWLHRHKCSHRDEGTFGTSLVCVRDCNASVMCNSFEHQYFESSLHPINLCLQHAQAKSSLKAFN